MAKQSKEQCLDMIAKIDEFSRNVSDGLVGLHWTDEDAVKCWRRQWWQCLQNEMTLLECVVNVAAEWCLYIITDSVFVQVVCLDIYTLAIEQ